MLLSFQVTETYQGFPFVVYRARSYDIKSTLIAYGFMLKSSKKISRFINTRTKETELKIRGLVTVSYNALIFRNLQTP